MFDLLVKLLEKEWNVIKSIPIHFTAVCVIATILTGLLWYAGFHTALDLKTATNEAYRERLESINTAIKSSPSQSVQVLFYTNDPNIEKVAPQPTNAAALAYSEDGARPLFTWDAKAQKWK